jgi:DNA modification methylase
MTKSASKQRVPAPPKGVSDFVATKARKRRATQRALAEIGTPKRRNDFAPPLELLTVPTKDLKPTSRQIRRRDTVQSAKIDASIGKFGVCRPILISADRTIVEGHGIWEAAKRLGVTEVPCIVIDHLDANELRLLPMALNRIAETGAWEVEALRLEFEELIVLGEDISATAFEMAEIDTLLLKDCDDASGAELDVPPSPPQIATSRRGDVWILGDHRLIQGDARQPEVYALLMWEGELATFVLTDPPYNVPNVGHVTGNADHREFACAHGEMSREEFANFNRAWMAVGLTYLIDGGLVLSCIDWRSVEIILACGRELGLELFNFIVWSKTNGGQGSLWRSQHELLPVFKKGGAPHINNVELGRHGRWRSNVWRYPGASSLGSDSRDGLALHPTVKPRAMLEDALLDVTNRDDIVLDCFAGSGSTLLAAEATGRRCRAIEIDGPYCDVIIARWRQMTGCDAVLETTGESFAEVAARRAAEAESSTTPSTSTQAARDPRPDFRGAPR